MNEMVERMARAMRRPLSRDPLLPPADDLRNAARALLADLSEDGYVIVPREPTEAMNIHMLALLGGDKPPTRRWRWVWQSMIEAVPKPY